MLNEWKAYLFHNSSGFDLSNYRFWSSISFLERLFK